MPAERRPSGVFQGGIGRADLTPPAVYPFFGYSLTSEHRACGFRTRLYARTFYLEGADGEAVALVQCDLAAIPAILHRQVASLVARQTGLGPDRILIAATHTHSGPGVYFGASFYNSWGANEAGFDPGLLGFLSERIAQSIRDAFENRGPALAAAGVCTIDGVTYNRSPEAWAANFGKTLLDRPGTVDSAVNKNMTMLRIDQITPGGTRPLGVWTNFAIHGTAIGTDHDLYDADCFGAAERYLEAAIRGQYDLTDADPVIHALTSGIAGDVGPAFVRRQRGFGEADRIGWRIAENAFDLFLQLADSLSESTDVRHAYREISLRHTIASSAGATLAPPQLGFPVLGGTEDGYSPVHFIWPGAEGSRATAADLEFGGIGVSLLSGAFSWNGYDSAKISAAGPLHDHFLPASGFPESVTLQVMRIGEVVLAAVPGEITTRMGRGIAGACSAAAREMPDVRHIALVSCANHYLSYFTTPAEYNAQHYEGAHSIWGEHAGEFIADELSALVAHLARGEAVSAPEHWTFSPGPYHRFADYRAVDRSPAPVDTVVVDTTLSGEVRISAIWWDRPAKKLNPSSFHWQIEVPGEGESWRVHRSQGITQPGSLPVDDTGLELTIRKCDPARGREILRRIGAPTKRKNQTLWQITWTPSEPLPPHFRYAMYDAPGGTLAFAQPVSLH